MRTALDTAVGVSLLVLSALCGFACDSTSDESPDGATIGSTADGGDGSDGGDAGSVSQAPPDAGSDHDAASMTYRSPGCGGAGTTGTSSYVHETITIGSTQRDYFLFVPATYSATRAYPLVFRWHGSGGDGTSGGLEIEAASKEDAIIASPSGIGGNWDLAPTGVDIALFDTLATALEGQYCVDTHRVFSYGFSLGAAFTNLLGCVRADVVRAIAPVEGWAPQTNCTKPVAAWMTHSPDDQAVTIDRGEAARDLFKGIDGCTATAMPVSPSPCVQYAGCPDHPVDWCQTSGPHNPQGAFTGPGAWGFFQSLL